MQKQLFLIIFTLLMLVFCQQAEALNPYIQTHPVRQGGKPPAPQNFQRPGKVNHHINARRPKGQVNRFTAGKKEDTQYAHKGEFKK